MIAAAAFLVSAAMAARGAPPSWLAEDRAVTLAVWAVLYSLIAIMAAMVFKLDRAPWRFVSSQDVYSVVSAAAAAAFCFLCVIFLVNRASELPRLTFILVGVVQAIGMLGARLLLRMAHERRSLRLLLPWIPPQATPGAPVVAAGTAAALAAALRDLEHRPDPRFEVVGLLSSEPRWRGQWIRDVEVLGGIDRLFELWRGGGAGRPSASGVLFVETPARLGLSDGDMARLREAGAVIYGMGDMPPGGPDMTGTEDLVQLVSGKRVMVVGAGGWLGTELCRQAAHLGCAHLALLDVSEFALYTVHTAMQRDFPELSISDVLCDVRDRTLVKRSIDKEKPHLVLHAAGLSVAGLAERHPGEVARTNVVGLRNVAAAAAGAGTETVALLSLVRGETEEGPVLAHARRLAEMTLAAGDPDGPQRVVVRLDPGEFLNADGVAQAARLALRAVAAAADGEDFELMAATPSAAGALVDLAQWRAGRGTGRAGAAERLLSPGESLEPGGPPGLYRLRRSKSLDTANPADLDELERLARRSDNSAVRGLMAAMAHPARRR